MSKVLSFKMRDDIYEETEKITHKIHMPRNAYINQAVDFYNKLRQRAFLKKQLALESKQVRDNSMEVLEAFDALGDDIEGM